MRVGASQALQPNSSLAADYVDGRPDRERPDPQANRRIAERYQGSLVIRDPLRDRSLMCVTSVTEEEIPWLSISSRSLCSS
jgi:hypothetical protein